MRFFSFLSAFRLALFCSFSDNSLSSVLLFLDEVLLSFVKEFSLLEGFFPVEDFFPDLLSFFRSY